jgi:hypothetical protein
MNQVPMLHAHSNLERVPFYLSTGNVCIQQMGFLPFVNASLLQASTVVLRKTLFCCGKNKSRHFFECRFGGKFMPDLRRLSPNLLHNYKAVILAIIA